MTKRDLVLDFIEQFNKFGPNVTDCFSNGMCYWFAHILHQRFYYDSQIMYDPVTNHFACLIDDRVYDITGEVTHDGRWDYWSSYQLGDAAHTVRLYRDCIYKVPDGITICALCDEAYEDDFGNLICPRDNGPRGDNEVCCYE
jgi:hypothetical protein